jgi:hypothetical protein
MTDIEILELDKKYCTRCNDYKEDESVWDETSAHWLCQVCNSEIYGIQSEAIKKLENLAYYIRKNDANKEAIDLAISAEKLAICIIDYERNLRK